MRLILLGLIPVVIFVGVYLFGLLLKFTTPEEAFGDFKWWYMPLYFSLAVPLLFGGIFLCMAIGAFALGATLPL